MYYVGLDVHYRTTTMCILDGCGRRVKFKTVRGHWTKAVDRLAELDGPFEVVFEATCGYGPLFDQLAQRARRVVMAHPGLLRLIFRATRKNDRVDAEKLAKLLYLDEVPAAHVPGVDVREWRELIEFRRRLVDKHTECKNQIRALIRGHGLTAPRSLWSRKGLAWLAGLSWPTVSSRLRRDMLLEDYHGYQRKIRTATRVLDRIGKRHPGVQLLRTIPGVGARTAEAIVAYLDDPQRFSRGSQVASYFGLVPRQDASGGVNRLGHISKQGPGTVRKYLVQAAWQAVRRDARVRARFERIAGGCRERRKVALVAVARWLAGCMFAMLRTGEVWREAA